MKIFDQNLTLSRKWYKIVPYSCNGTPIRTRMRFIEWCQDFKVNIKWRWISQKRYEIEIYVQKIHGHDSRKDSSPTVSRSHYVNYRWLMRAVLFEISSLDRFSVSLKGHPRPYNTLVENYGFSTIYQYLTPRWGYRRWKRLMYLAVITPCKGVTDG